MRTHHLLGLAVYLMGCYAPASVSIGNNDMTGVSTDASMRSDLPHVTLPCAAAKGLAGDNLLCVDFDKVTQLTDQALADWNFNANMLNCWQISGGMLQVQNFGGFRGNCGLTLKPFDLTQPDKKYSSVTLSLLHRIDLNDPEQQAQMFLDIDNSALLAHQMTGKPGFPTLLTTTLTINKSDLPGHLMSVYKFFLKVSSTNVNGGRKGWQIKSIAINGNP